MTCLLIVYFHFVNKNFTVYSIDGVDFCQKLKYRFTDSKLHIYFWSTNKKKIRYEKST